MIISSPLRDSALLHNFTNSSVECEVLAFGEVKHAIVACNMSI